MEGKEIRPARMTQETSGRLPVVSPDRDRFSISGLFRIVSVEFKDHVTMPLNSEFR